MKLSRTLYFSAALLAIGAASSCSSDSSSCVDGGDAGCTTSASDASDASDAPTLFRLPAGTSCAVVTQVAPGSVDGCDLGVADAAKNDPVNFLPITIPINYDTSTGVVTLGTDGALGGGPVVNNRATLVRENDTSLTGTPACTWHQKDTSLFELIADATFTVDVTEDESNFAAACSTTAPCTSTWRWTMTRSTKTPPCL